MFSIYKAVTRLWFGVIILFSIKRQHFKEIVLNWTAVQMGVHLFIQAWLCKFQGFLKTYYYSFQGLQIYETY